MSSDLGSSTVLMTGVVGMIAAMSLATAGLGHAYGAKAQAQTAADAAALAAAVATYPPATQGAPRQRARMAAGANGATLVSCVCQVDGSRRPRIVTVGVVIEVDVPIFGQLGISATSRAEFDPGLWLGR